MSVGAWGRERKYQMSPKQAAEPSARGEREWHGVFKKAKEAERLECGEWQEIRVATHPGHSHYQFGPRQIRVRREEEQAGGPCQAPAHCGSQETRPMDTTRREKIFKKKFSPVSKTHWRVRSASQAPHPL